MVALRKESVDRNFLPFSAVFVPLWSLSARRAWIEIDFVTRDADRVESLSARRAWIEMTWKPQTTYWSLVALRKESVDRNW